MNQAEAYNEMVKGNRVRNEYYSPEEYAFINSDGKIETEDGCVMGSKFDEFWHCYQSNLGGEWSVINDSNSLIDNLEPYLGTNKFIEHFTTCNDAYDMSGLYLGCSPKLKHSAHYEHVRTESKINRNSACPCGSGLKYKKCCININN